ncbi:hypothetical protein K2173_024932 [Erythroxylum novogranatense]|uniref:Methyltransferase n=1 Tax=Erythroxylum novogranatense TaxID=1862640 RepID=A0AAV8UGB7_9ROSI|nr:hypothetical protein K2173_024932 [Erythroxylum novogranatense]
MSNPVALDLAAALGGKIEKNDVLSPVENITELVTSFYEFGWGESFHFVLDVGCGIGGPLREISQFSLTSATGLNNNEYQITRGKELNHIAGVDKTCDFVKADFMKMPFPESSFDAVYVIEATCHAPDIDWTSSPLPWYLPLDKNHFSFSSFRLTAVKALEYVGIAPKGSLRVQDFLEKAAEGLVEGGRREIFMPMFFFLARKPLVESQ